MILSSNIERRELNELHASEAALHFGALRPQSYKSNHKSQGGSWASPQRIIAHIQWYPRQLAHLDGDRVQVRDRDPRWEFSLLSLHAVLFMKNIRTLPSPIDMIKIFNFNIQLIMLHNST